MKLPGWPRKHPDPRDQEVVEQAARSRDARDRVERVIDKAIEVLPDGAMREIRRTEHAAGHEHG